MPGEALISSFPPREPGGGQNSHLANHASGEFSGSLRNFPARATALLLCRLLTIFEINGIGMKVLFPPAAELVDEKDVHP